MTERYFIEIAYKGTAYKGWQIQPNGPTVQQILQDSLSTILNESIDLTGASRTDTGVHARQIFAHFDTPTNLPGKIVYRLNSILPPDIAVINIYPVKNEAHARFDAISRSYEYIIYFRKEPFMLDAGYRFRFKRPDPDLLNQAAAVLMEYSDFDSFCKSGTQVKTKQCEIYHAKWKTRVEKDQLVFHITANRFLRGMVRALVNTMLLVGRKKINIPEFRQIIESKDNRKADFAAPPQGLYLTRVKYPYRLKPLRS